MDLEDVLTRFDALTDRLLTDPEAVRREFDQQIAAEKGEAWVAEHQAELDADWQAIRELFGL